LTNPRTAIHDLKQACQKAKIRKIEGFGVESEAKILKEIDEYLSRTKRILLPYATKISSDILNFLKKEPSVLSADPLGSLRRRCSTVGDIDISVASNYPEAVITHFAHYPGKTRVLEAGKATASILLKNGHQVDLMIQPPDSYGALLQHFTGSKHHNIKLREVALRRGCSLSEYGVRMVKKGEKLDQGGEKNPKPKRKLIKFDSEEKFYHFLGMEWIPPELREDAGEIEMAIEKNLPKLVEIKDIKGDFHLHSNFPLEPSHDLGENSAEEMIERASLMGYEYLAFTEHNPSVSQHSSRQIIDLLKRKKEMFERVRASPVGKQMKRIFNCLEVDIRPDGNLAIPESGVEYLDFIIVAIHSSFKLERAVMTKRILRALANPKVKILAHPTGRILNKREGYELDWETIFAFCLENRKILEISAFPNRLDLPDVLVQEAVKKGVKLIIGTDAHRVEEMAMMPFGVYVARRGWAEKKDIINTYPVEVVNDILLS
jgi:DNA polymerase (family 10)